MSNDELNGEKSYSAPALEKGLDILEHLAERASAVSARDLAERLGRSKNEIFRMIHVLIARGYVQRDGATDELALTNKLFALGLRTPKSRSLLEAALPEMIKLAAEVDQSPHLAIVHQGRTVTLGHIPTNGDYTFNMNTGYGRLASDATTGKVIMAFQPDETMKRMFADCDRQSGKKIDRLQLEGLLAEIRERGYVIDKSTDFVGVTDICCPILKAYGAVACINIPHVGRVDVEVNADKILKAVQAACKAIGKIM